jgi:fructose-1,6-bisphosphatase I
MGTAGQRRAARSPEKLDIIAEVLIEANPTSGHLAAMASEEMDSIYLVPHRYPQGEFVADV